MADPSITEFIHEMISESNEKPKGKVFYYSEEEVKMICKQLWSQDYGEFDAWWDKHKKK